MPAGYFLLAVGRPIPHWQAAG